MFARLYLSASLALSLVGTVILTYTWLKRRYFFLLLLAMSLFSFFLSLLFRYMITLTGYYLFVAFSRFFFLSSFAIFYLISRSSYSEKISHLLDIIYFPLLALDFLDSLNLITYRRPLNPFTSMISFDITLGFIYRYFECIIIILLLMHQLWRVKDKTTSMKRKKTASSLFYLILGSYTMISLSYVAQFTSALISFMLLRTIIVAVFLIMSLDPALILFTTIRIYWIGILQEDGTFNYYTIHSVREVNYILNKIGKIVDLLTRAEVRNKKYSKIEIENVEIAGLDCNKYKMLVIGKRLSHDVLYLLIHHCQKIVSEKERLDLEDVLLEIK
ncbi:MAG: hypothetical protein ACP6IP_02090 [Candidatus Njordarchaeia archaeon]